MTQVSSTAKMVGQLKRWLTGDETSADGHQSDEPVPQARHCPTCTCGNERQHYRGRSYSDCCAVAGRNVGRHDADVRERSCSVNSRQMTTSIGSQRQPVPATGWSSTRHRNVRQVLEEDGELHQCPHQRSVEPVCCCERCFVYTDDRLSEFMPPLPPSYSELMLQDRCADLDWKCINVEPSISEKQEYKKESIDSATVDGCSVSGKASLTFTDTSTETRTNERRKSSGAGSLSVGHSLTSSVDSLPVSIPRSLDGEEGFTESQRRLQWARRQRLIDDAMATASCPPPNRTICHIVDCW